MNFITTRAIFHTAINRSNSNSLSKHIARYFIFGGGISVSFYSTLSFFHPSIHRVRVGQESVLSRFSSSRLSIFQDTILAPLSPAGEIKKPGHRKTRSRRAKPLLRLAIVISGENDPGTRDLLCDTSHICTYLGSESIVGRAPLARATSSWLLGLPRPDHESPLTWHDSGPFPPSRSAFSGVSPSAGFYGDGMCDIRAYMFTGCLRMLRTHAEDNVCARGDHARESGAADKLMTTSSERVGSSHGKPRPRLSRSLVLPRSPYRRY